MPAWGWFATWLAGMAALVMLAGTVLVPRVEAREREAEALGRETDRRILENLHVAMAPLVSGPIVLTVVDREVDLEGEVPDTGEHDAIVAAANAGEGVRGVIDRLVVKSIAADAASGRRAPAAPASPDRALDAGPTAGPGPEASPPAPPASPASPSSAALPRTDARASAATRPATLSLRAVDGALKLDGAVGEADAARLAAFTGPAIAAFDPDYLENTVQTPADVGAAPWLDGLTRLLVPLAGLGAPSVDIDADRLVIGGTAASADARASVVDAANELFPDHTLVERIAVDERAADGTPPNGGSGAEGADDTLAFAEMPDPSKAPAADADPATSRAALQQAFDALDDRRILFASATAAFTGESGSEVATIADLLKRHPGVRVEIEGHTDAAGDARANLALSQQRANAVRDALVEAGVPRDRLVAYGYGEGVPVADNSTREGRARNRRIEFRF